MRFGFATCVQLGAEVLDEIHKLEARVDAVITLKDHLAPDKSGRVYVDDLAELHQAELHKTSNINDATTVDWLRSMDLDWLFIIGWSQIAHEEVLTSARYGSLGMHPTLLPEGRGRASIPWAIIKGLPRTGVTFFKLDTGVDTGPILDTLEIPLGPQTTASTLYLDVMNAHRQLLRNSLGDLVSSSVTFSPQHETEASFWPARRPEDGQITSSITVAEAETLVRALTPPYPGARWTDMNGKSWQISGGHAGDTGPGLRIPLADGTYTATIFRSL